MKKIRMKRHALLIIALLTCSVFVDCQLQEFINLNPNPTAREKLMPEAKYFDPEFASLPADVETALVGAPIDSGTALKFRNINDLLDPGYLESENGYCLNPDGTGFVAVKTDFPGVTGDMIQWWFWWHANADIRYKIWCPDDHYAIRVKNKKQANDKSLSYEKRRVNNIHYPIEDTGNGIFELSIRFVSPETFGFDTSRFRESGIEAVVCGVVGYVVGGVTINHTKMVHLFRRKGDGLELRSRFWPGILLGKQLRKLAITEDVAEGLALHCAYEYSHLAGFLPEIYGEFGE